MDASTKRCTGCGETKPLEEFNKRAASRDGRQLMCRGCFQEWQRSHRAARATATRQRRAEVHRDGRAQLIAYLRAHPCVDCGETDVIVLEFDHRVRADKRASVAWLLHAGYSWEVIAAEIAKCDVRCCNCHRLRTREQMGWWS